MPVTQEKINDFMSDMSSEMMKKNIPIVNFIVHDFPYIKNEPEKKN